MPADTLTPDDIWSKRVTFLCIDTEVIQRAGFQFGKGELHQLPHQLPDGLHLILSPIIEQEVMSHRMGSVEEAMSKMDSAIVAIKRTSGLDVQPLTETIAALDAKAAARKQFSEEMDEFVKRCNGKVLDLGDLDGHELFSDYFDQNAPFEAKKKCEFPDAATLQLLKHYAEVNHTMGIVVSGDSGWEQYANTSDCLFYMKSIAALTALFVATGQTADEVAEKVKGYLDDSESPIRNAIADAIRKHVTEEAYWDTSEFIPDIGNRMEMEIAETSVTSISLEKRIEIWEDDDDSEFAWIVAVSAHVEVELNGFIYLYVWDSIDREEIALASEQKTLGDSIDVNFFIRLTNVRLDVDAGRWNIDVDIAPATYSLGFREIVFDMR